MMKIIPGPASKHLGERLGQLLKAEVIPVSFKFFPDGESYIRYEAESLQGEDVAIIQTTSPPQEQRIIQLLLMADNAKDMKARSITAVVPYFAYSRQDKRFLPGEVFSTKTIVRLLESCGVNRIITFNAHNPVLLKTLNVQVEDLSAFTVLAEYFKERVKNPFSLSLGKKGLDVAAEADKVLQGGFDFVSSIRDVHNGKVTLEEKKLAVKDRNVIVFDDIISSGGTMARAVKMTKEQGARKVYVACVHPLLVGDSRRRILENGANEIVGTDTVPSAVSKVSVAPLIGSALAERGA